MKRLLSVCVAAMLILTGSMAYAGTVESAHLHGVYTACDYDQWGILKWCDTADNVVTDVGANLTLTTMWGGSQNTTFYLGLISSVGYTGIPLTSDTMSSHSTSGHVWAEAGNGSNYPNWSTPSSNARATVTWGSASARTISIASAASFTIATNGGTVEGCFIVTGSGAVATNNNTSGTLYSAGVFTGGAKAVSVGDTLQVSYSTSM